MLQKSMKICSLWEGLLLQRFMEDCFLWEAPQAEAGHECEESSPWGGRSSTNWPQPPFPVCLCCCGEELENLGVQLSLGRMDGCGEGVLRSGCTNDSNYWAFSVSLSWPMRLLFSLPCPAEEGSDRTALVGTWHPTINLPQQTTGHWTLQRPTS